MDASNLESLAIQDLTAVTGGGFLDNLKVDVSADLNKLVDSVGSGAQRLIGCGFGANSRQEFGRCVLGGNLDPQK